VYILPLLPLTLFLLEIIHHYPRLKVCALIWTPHQPVVRKRFLASSSRRRITSRHLRPLHRQQVVSIFAPRDQRRDNRWRSHHRARPNGTHCSARPPLANIPSCLPALRPLYPTPHIYNHRSLAYTLRAALLNILLKADLIVTHGSFVNGSRDRTGVFSIMSSGT
jgi:hypothetical protein